MNTFDTIAQSVILKILERRGVLRKLINYSIALAVDFDRVNKKVFKGVRQGYVLSPLLQD